MKASPTKISPSAELALADVDGGTERDGEVAAFEDDPRHMKVR